MKGSLRSEAPARSGPRGTRGELLRRLGRDDEARSAYQRALELATSIPERRFLARRLEQLSASPGPIGPWMPWFARPLIERPWQSWLRSPERRPYL